MLAVLVEAARCAIRAYIEICIMTFGKDHRTYDMAPPSGPAYTMQGG